MTERELLIWSEKALRAVERGMQGDPDQFEPSKLGQVLFDLDKQVGKLEREEAKLCSRALAGAGCELSAFYLTVVCFRHARKHGLPTYSEDAGVLLLQSARHAVDFAYGRWRDWRDALDESQQEETSE